MMVEGNGGISGVIGVFGTNTGLIGCRAAVVGRIEAGL